VSRSEQRTASADIFEHLRRLHGPEAEQVVSRVVTLLQTGEAQQAMLVLCEFDARIGGFGLHTLVACEAAKVEPYVTKDRPLYRPVQYVGMSLSRSHPEELTRWIAEMACAHVEGVLKRIAQSGFLGRIVAGFMPMGQLLRRLFRGRLPDTLYQDLLWLNDGIYIFAKHDFNAREDMGEDDALDAHMFDLDEAIAVYLIARRLVVELEHL
jgi:hypothetical protein